MTVREIALETLEEELKQYTQRPKPLAKTFLELIVNQKDNKGLHSCYLNPLQNFFSKSNTPNKEEYLKQVSNSYQVSVKSKKYTQGKELKRLKDKIILDINLSDIKEEEPKDTDILIHKDNLKNLKSFSIITKIQSKHKELYSIPLEAKQEAVYFNYVGRQYNNFNRMSKADRLLTNTPYEIDLSSAVQTLYVNQYALIKDISYLEALKIFPSHKEYIQNKQAIREKLSVQENKSIDDIKKELTKISFRGGSNNYTGIYLGLFNETKIISKTVLDLINKMDDRLPIKKFITERYKKKDQERKQEIKAQKEKIEKTGKKEKLIKNITFRSKLAFWYEYQESIIRDTMLDYVDDTNTKQVHDAIYISKEIDKKKLQGHIESETGFIITL